MSPQIGCSPTWPIDGTPPVPPRYSIIGAAQIKDDVDADEVERWMNGVAVYPYPPDKGQVWDSTAHGLGSTEAAKGSGTAPPLPKFGPITVYLPETCSSYGIWDGGMSQEEAQRRFASRAELALNAVDAAALEREFMTGEILGANPHLGDGTGSFPNGDAVTSILNGFALLENQVAAETGRGGGWIHCSPAVAMHATRLALVQEVPAGPAGAPVLRTVNGTLVVPGSGYAPGTEADGTPNPPLSTPDGHPAPSAGQEWIYATCPVEIRRSPAITSPENVSRALDRETNTITYRVERYYVVSWDTVFKAAVLVDWCQTTC